MRAQYLVLLAVAADLFISPLLSNRIAAADTPANATTGEIVVRVIDGAGAPSRTPS